MHKKINPTNLDQYRVQIRHYRYNPDKGLIDPSIDNSYQKGGATIATLTHKDTQHVHYGFAFCSPKDSFNRKIGKNEAIRRAYLLSEMKPYNPAYDVMQKENDRVLALMSENGFDKEYGWL